MKTTKLLCQKRSILVGIRRMFILLLFAVFMFSCQEEINPVTENNVNTEQLADLKSAAITVSEIDALIEKIEGYAASGMIEPGIANSLISKLENAKKSLGKGNHKAVLNQVEAVINQLGALADTGTIDDGLGEELLDDAIDIPKEDSDYGGELTDPRDGKVYKTVKIGDQCWMAENLAYLPSVTPFEIKSDYIPYNYVWGFWKSDVEEARLTISYLTYGTLYNWPAAASACPAGWHLPSDAEWNQLAQYIDSQKGPYENDEWEWKELGIHLKATSGWMWDGNGTDDFGFKALPGGYILNGSINSQGYGGLWWTSTKYNDGTYSWKRQLYSGTNIFTRDYSRDINALSVRCIKDN